MIEAPARVKRGQDDLQGPCVYNKEGEFWLRLYLEKDGLCRAILAKDTQHEDAISAR